MDTYLNINLGSQFFNNLSLPFLYFVNYYFYNKFLGFKNIKYIFFIIQIIITLIDAFISNLLGDLGSILMFFLIQFAAVYLLCDGKILIKLYAVTVSNITQLLVNLMFLVIDIKFTPVLNKLLNVNYSNYKILNCLVINLCDMRNFFIMFLFLKCICGVLSARDTNISIYKALYLLIPNISIYGISLVFFVIQKIKINNSNYFLFDIFTWIYYSLPLIFLFMLMSVFIMAYMFSKMLNDEEEKERLILMNQQFIHNKNIERVYNNLRSTLHDMNNHISCLKNLANNEKVEDIKIYLKNMGYAINKIDFNIKTGNTIADAVLNEKYSIARENNIQFQCDFMIPREISIKPIDLSIILNNALDNAIEACAKIEAKGVTKKISVKSYIRGNYAIIEMANTIHNKIMYNEGSIITTKVDALRHGFGLSNIKKTVKKYNGAVDIKEEKNKFTLNIMIKIK